MENKHRLKKIIFTVIIFTQIIAIIIFLWHSQSTDKKYSRLISSEINNFSTLQHWTAESNKRYFNLFASIQNVPAIKSDSLLKTWGITDSLMSPFLDTIRHRSLLTMDTGYGWKELISSRKEYVRQVNLLLSQGNNTTETEEVRFRKYVTPAFNKYQTALRTFTQDYQFKIDSLNKEISKSISTTAYRIAFLGFSPIVLIIAFIILQLLVFGFLLWKFRDIEWER